MVTTKRYMAMRDDLENDAWWWKRRATDLEKRLNESEKAREELENKANLLMADSIMLHEKRNEAMSKLYEAERKIKELNLRIMSMEARRGGAR